MAAITPGVQRSRDGRIARFGLVFSNDPYTTRAFNRVPALRKRVSDLGPGVRGVIGGGSATQYGYFWA